MRHLLECAHLSLDESGNAIMDLERAVSSEPIQGVCHVNYEADGYRASLGAVHKAMKS